MWDLGSITRIELARPALEAQRLNPLDRQRSPWILLFISLEALGKVFHALGSSSVKLESTQAPPH